MKKKEVILKSIRNVKLVEFISTSGLPIYEVKKRHWLFWWKWVVVKYPGPFGGFLEWFADLDVAKNCYKDTIA